MASASLMTLWLFRPAVCMRHEVTSLTACSDAAAVPAHLAIRACRRRICPRSDLCQGCHSQPGSRGRHRPAPSTCLHTRSTPHLWSSSHDTRRAPSSCWDMYSPCRGRERRKQREGEKMHILNKFLNKTSGTPLDRWVTSAVVQQLLGRVRP